MYSTQTTTFDGFSVAAQVGLPDGAGGAHAFATALPTARNYSLGNIADGVRERLVRVLSDERDNIVAGWSHALRQGADACYKTLPEEVLQSGLRVLFDADARFLAGCDPDDLRDLVAAVARVRLSQGFPLAALEAAIGAMRAVVLPLVIREFSAEPENIAAAVEAILRVEEISSVRLAEVYQEVADAEIMAARNTVLSAEHEKVVFCREMVRVTTREKLVICDHDDIPARDVEDAIEISTPRDVRRARRLAAKVAKGANLDAKGSYSLELCIGEAATNAIRHAGRADFQVWRDEGGSVSFRLADQGNGIDLHRIPIALRAGFSTGSSLGMGFTLMLELADRILLATDGHGTTLLLTVDAAPDGHTPAADGSFSASVE